MICIYVLKAEDDYPTTQLKDKEPTQVATQPVGLGRVMSNKLHTFLLISVVCLPKENKLIPERPSLGFRKVGELSDDGDVQESSIFRVQVEVIIGYIGLDRNSECSK